MGFSKEIHAKYEIHNFYHAVEIMEGGFKKEWKELNKLLNEFTLLATDIVYPGGRKSPIAEKLDGRLYKLGWEEKKFDIRKIVDDFELDTPTHKIDCYKNQIGLEIEWNNKDPFYDRDLTNFRILHENKAISLGILITRSDELQDIFNELGKGKSYGASTTHMSKLLPRIYGGNSGGCPLIIIGITKECFVNDL
jgi:hypothetical protein